MHTEVDTESGSLEPKPSHGLVHSRQAQKVRRQNGPLQFLSIASAPFSFVLDLTMCSLIQSGDMVYGEMVLADVIGWDRDILDPTVLG